MKKKWLWGAVIFVVIACLSTVFSSTAEDFDDWDLIEPLGGTTSSDALIVKKSRIIITHQKPDNWHWVHTWRGQSADVEATLNKTGEEYRSDFGEPWVPFGIGATAGTVRENFTLGDAFYGTVSYDNLPKTVLCNTYLVRNKDKDKFNETSIFIRLTDTSAAGGGSGGFIELSSLPKPVYKFKVNYERNKDHYTSPMDVSLAHEVLAYDWNGDGYSDYLINYVHNPSGNGNFASTVAMLAVVDGKSLVDGKPVVSSAPVDMCPTYSTTDFTSSLTNTDPVPNSFRVACGDFNGDGMAEAAILFTKVRPADAFEMGRGDVLAMFEITASSDGKFVFDKRYEEEIGTWVNGYTDGVAVAAGDMDGDGRDELATVLARADTLYGMADAHLALWKWDEATGNFDTACDWREETDIFGKPDDGAGHHNWYVPPLHVALADLDGNGSVEFVWSSMRGTSRSWTEPDRVLVLSVHATTDSESGFTRIMQGETYNTHDQLHWVGSRFYHKHSLATGLFHMDLDTSNSIITNSLATPKQIAIAQMGDAGGENDAAALDWAVLSYKGGKLVTMGNGSTANAVVGTHAAPAIAAVDTDRESLVMGIPTVFYITGDIEEITEAQAPPRHWDSIGGKIYEAYAWLSDYCTKLATSEGYTSAASHSGGFDVSAGASVKAAVTSHVVPTNPPLFSATKYIAGGIAYNGTEEKSSSFSTKFDARAEIDDQVYYRVNDYTMWRYPVLYPSSDRLTASGDQMFINCAVPQYTGTAFFPTFGRDVEWYEPLHDNYNLFTYPCELSGTTGYPSNAERVLTYSKNQTFGNPDPASAQIDVAESVVGSHMVDVNVNLGNEITLAPQSAIKIGKGAGAKDSSGYINFALNNDDVFKYSYVTKNDYSKMNSVMINWPGSKKYVNSGGLTNDDQKFVGDIGYYLRDDGPLCTAYAVSRLYSARSAIWGDSSPYRQQPDPGLVLPFRVDTLRQTESTALNRLTIRGGLVLKSDMENDAVTNRSFLTGQVPGRAVSADSDVSCVLRVVNYSFLDVDKPVHVEYLLQKIESVSEAPDVALAEFIGSKDITAEVEPDMYPGVIIPGRESVTSKDVGGTTRYLDNWIYDTFKWHTPFESTLAYLHVRLSYGGEQVTASNDVGNILIGVYRADETVDAATMSALNVEVREVMEDGTLGDPLDKNNLPHDKRLRVKFNVKGFSAETGRRRFIRGLRFMLLTEKNGLIAGRTLPLFDIGKLDGLELNYTPSNAASHRPNGMKLMVYSPFTKFSNGNTKLFEMKFRGESSGGGCVAGFGLLALLAIAPLALFRKKR